MYESVSNVYLHQVRWLLRLSAADEIRLLSDLHMCELPSWKQESESRDVW